MPSTVIESPIGPLALRQEGEALCAVHLMPQGTMPVGEHTPLLDEAGRQIGAYFAGALRVFDLPLCPKGSAFDLRVWALLRQIPFGQLRSYGELAGALGSPRASRAVGGACGRNPLLIVVPCHRVVGVSGRLTGFAAGLPAKRALLTREGFDVRGDRLYR